jgi:hypothetical protein
MIPNQSFNEPNILYATVSIHDAIIPCSFYNIDTNNNYLDIVYNAYSTRITIPSGNYNSTTFMQTMQSLLGNSWTMTYSTITGKYTMATYQSFSFLGNSPLASIIGFNTNISADFNGAVFFIAMPLVANFYTIPRINIRCTKFATSQQITNSSSSICCLCDILATIPNDQPINGRICYKNLTQIKNDINLQDLQQFQITFSDDMGVPINFNGVSCQFGLLFEIHRLVPQIPKLSFGAIYSSAQLKNDEDTSPPN